MKKERGQVSGIDFLFALAVFSIIFASYSVWMSQLRPVDGAEESALLLFSIRHMLFEGPGVPEDWNETNVKVLGLVQERMVVDQSKLARFLAMNYSRIHSLVGAGVHDFYFELAALNGTLIASKGVSGENNSMIIQARSPVVYNDTVAMMLLRLSR